MATIKFFWNGIKVDGSNLIRAHFSCTEAWTMVSGREVLDHMTIFARDYMSGFGALREFFTVENDSDSMTDYFEHDSIRVTPDHPMFELVVEAWEKQEERQAKKWEKRGIEKRAAAIREEAKRARRMLERAREAA